MKTQWQKDSSWSALHRRIAGVNLSICINASHFLRLFCHIQFFLYWKKRSVWLRSYNVWLARCVTSRYSTQPSKSLMSTGYVKRGELLSGRKQCLSCVRSPTWLTKKIVNEKLLALFWWKCKNSAILVWSKTEKLNRCVPKHEALVCGLLQCLSCNIV